MGILTTAGLAKLAQAQQSGIPLVIDQIIFANYPGLNPETTPPVSTIKPTADKIVHTATVMSGFINNDTVIYKTQLLPNIGNFPFNWVGLFSSSTNTLIAVSYQEIQTKNKTEGFTTGNIIVKSFAIQYAQLKSLVGVTIQASLDYVDVVDLINGKADKNHPHKITDVESLQTTLDSKSPTHSHPYAASSHGHTTANITGLESALNAKAEETHAHAISDVNNLQAKLDEKVGENHTHTDLATKTHSHAIAQVSNLQSTLDAKAPSSHQHAIDTIMGLVQELAKKSDTTHSHQALADLAGQLGNFATKDLSNSTNPFLIFDAWHNFNQATGQGYIKLKNGIKVQYGSVNPNASSFLVTFPIPFANNAYMILGCRTISNNDTGGIENTYVPVYGDNFNLKRHTYCRFTSQSGSDNYISWIAIGY